MFIKSFFNPLRRNHINKTFVKFNKYYLTTRCQCCVLCAVYEVADADTSDTDTLKRLKTVKTEQCQ